MKTEELNKLIHEQLSSKNPPTWNRLMGTEGVTIVHEAGLLCRRTEMAIVLLRVLRDSKTLSYESINNIIDFLIGE